MHAVSFRGGSLAGNRFQPVAGRGLPPRAGRECTTAACAVSAGGRAVHRRGVRRVRREAGVEGDRVGVMAYARRCEGQHRGGQP